MIRSSAKKKVAWLMAYSCSFNNGSGNLAMRMRRWLVSKRNSHNSPPPLTIILSFRNTFIVRSVHLSSLRISPCVPVILQGKFTWAGLFEVLTQTMKTTAMMFFILFGALTFTNYVNMSGMTRDIQAALAVFGDTPMMTILVMLCIYLVLGCVLESLSMIMLTVPVFYPIVAAQGIDLIWFGIFVVVVVEMAQITPPIGFNLFVLQGMTGHEMSFISKAAFPMFLLMVLMVFVLILFPDLATWLPDNIRSAPRG